MLHRFFRGLAVARAKAASRIADANPRLALIHEISLERWEDARRHHGDAPEILRGLAAAHVGHAIATQTVEGIARALDAMDALARLTPHDPREPLLRGMAHYARGKRNGDAVELREALAHLRRAREWPGTILPFVALALEAEAAAQRALADLTRDPRDARRAEELERRREGIPVTFAGR